MQPPPPPLAGLSDSAFRVIVDTLSIPVLVVDGVGTIVHAGGSVLRDFGYEPHELRGRNVIEFTPAEEVDRALQSIDELTRHDELGIGVPTAFPIIRKDGTRTWMVIGAVPLLDPPVEGMTFYFLPWDAQLHFDEFFSSLLAGDPLDVVLTRLALSVAISLEVAGVSIHHGFDGSGFQAISGAGHPAGLEAVADGPWHRAARTGEPQHGAVSAIAGIGPDVEASGLRGCWAIPVPPHEGLDPLDGAVMTVWRRVHVAPVRAHDFVIDRSLRYVQLALVRSAEHRQLAHLADHDHLTGVANRTRFERIVGEALARSTGDVAVLYCDLDGFKAVNDERGHAVGDELLIEVARRLTTAVGAAGEVARIGGDEFTVILPDGGAVARQAADRLVAAFSRPVDVDGEPVALGLSVGLVVGSSSSAEELMRRADVALYAAKEAGGAQVVEFGEGRHA